MSYKVLHLISSPQGIGGAEKLLLDMADIHSSARFSISYCNLFGNGKSEFDEAVRGRQLSTFQLRGKGWQDLPKMILDLVNLFNREKFDIIHTHLFHATILGQIAAKIARIPATITSQHYTTDMFRDARGRSVKPLTISLVKYATGFSDKIIAVSEAVKRDLLKSGFADSKITVIYNGINLQNFEETPANFPHQDKSGDDFIIGSTGSLTERKGHEFLIRAMPQILLKNPASKLVIVGEGEQRKNLERLINELELKEKVSLVGFQTDVSRQLKRFDLYVHPSLYEPFGIAILEALAAEKAVVATKVEGIPEIIVDGETGILVSPANPDELANAVCWVMAHPKQAEQMGKAGRERAEKFDIRRVVSQYESLYLGLLVKKQEKVLV